MVTLKRALDNVKPAIEVKSRRVGGATYQVPIEVKGTRGTTLALRWLVGYAQARREKTMSERLMNEILDASNGLGAAVKKREDTHKMAESNRPSPTTAGEPVRRLHRAVCWTGAAGGNWTSRTIRVGLFSIDL